VALWMKQNAVLGTLVPADHTGDTMMKTPSRDSGDPYTAYGAEPTLELPEKAKCSSTPKRRRHMIRFAFLEVGFVGGVVWVGFAFDLDVSLNGRATGEQQVHLT
jgi:hypothetical protein